MDVHKTNISLGFNQLRAAYVDSLKEYCKRCLETCKENLNVDIEVQRTHRIKLTLFSYSES